MSQTLAWLLDLYLDPQYGLTLWFLTEEGQRLRLRQPFPVAFYAAEAPSSSTRTIGRSGGERTEGRWDRLRALWRFLQNQSVPVCLSRTERTDLFRGPTTVLAVEVQNPNHQPGLFARVRRRFPELLYYDADIPLNLRYAALHHVFPLAHCEITFQPSGGSAEDVPEAFSHEAFCGPPGRLTSVTPLESPWTIAPSSPPLRVLRVQPDADPFHAQPTCLHFQIDRYRYRLPLPSLHLPALPYSRPLLVNFAAILRRHDPDVLLTAWGDTWLLPYLLERSEAAGVPLPLSRDPDRTIEHRKALSYHSYGQIVYRGRQIHLFGRFHIDRHNAMLFSDYELEGVFETARVTGLPLQTAARVSPGSGISAMQIVTALRRKILVPWHKQQTEHPKTASQLIHADRGGMVYQPILGLHRNVAEIDFVSMYPAIMVRHNISPETKRRGHEFQNGGVPRPLRENEGGSQPSRGLVPETLAPLLAKRITLKHHIGKLPPWHPSRRVFEARSRAQKWLLVTCFGYLGYKNARFGRIEAHEAVTAYGREALLRAKEAAEARGYTVLHMYVDGLWVQNKDGTHIEEKELNALLDEIAARTDLPVALEGRYHWIAFLPSRQDPRIPVANRYFGLFKDGRIKKRGIACRRRDTALFIKQVQMELLAGLPADLEQLSSCLPALLADLQGHLSALRKGGVPLERLVVAQKLSRVLDAYRVPSPAAHAAAQLAAVGKPPQPGQRVPFLYTRGQPGVLAWDLPGDPDPAAIDADRYARLLLRAAHAVLQPFGVEERTLRDWLFSRAGYGAPPGVLPKSLFAL